MLIYLSTGEGGGERVHSRTFANLDFVKKKQVVEHFIIMLFTNRKCINQKSESDHLPHGVTELQCYQLNQFCQLFKSLAQLQFAAGEIRQEVQ